MLLLIFLCMLGFDKKDEDDDKNNGGSYGCGGNSGFNSPGRFIC